MYDTLNFWVDRAMVGDNPFSIAPYLSDHTEHNSKEGGYNLTGKAGNYSVFICNAGISLKGSLSKFLLPDNIHTLNRSGVYEAIQKLSNDLHLPIDRAKVTRVDVSAVLPMKREPKEYYPFMGDKPHFQRLQATKNTLYYNTIKKQLIFYDKKAEAKAKGVTIPAGFEGANLLRVEARFLSRLSKQFNLAEITGATLTDEKFYTGMVKRWGDEYFSIHKLKPLSIMDATNIKTVTDGKNMAFAMLLQKEGQSFIDAYIAELKAKKTYTDPENYTRVKKGLNELIAASTATDQSDLINELDKAVNEIILNCR